MAKKLFQLFLIGGLAKMKRFQIFRELIQCVRMLAAFPADTGCVMRDNDREND